MIIIKIEIPSVIEGMIEIPWRGKMSTDIEVTDENFLFITEILKRIPEIVFKVLEQIEFLEDDG